MMTDPIADMLTRIRNGNSAKHKTVEIPASRMKKELAQILLDEGYIKGYNVTEDGKQGIITVELKYGPNNEKVISGIKRISKPGLRIYVKGNEIPRVLGGLGIAIISTSKGIVADKEARKLGVGGEVICYVLVTDQGGLNMSRIGLKPIEIPAGVTITISDDNVVEVKGPKGTISEKIDKSMEIKIEDGVLTVSRPSDLKRFKALHGLSRTLVMNMVEGVTKGYEKSLEIIGTGYRAAKSGKKLTLNLGYSHPIEMEDPEGIEVEVPGPNQIIVRGINKQQVGNYAAVLRDFRRPEPYKGKGVRYKGEMVRRKVGKTGK